MREGMWWPLEAGMCKKTDSPPEHPPRKTILPTRHPRVSTGRPVVEFRTTELLDNKSVLF